MHTMTTAACSECGDLDGCHLRSRLRRFRDAVEHWRLEFQQYGVTVPKVVTLCGSTRFPDAWAAAQRSETLAGRIVLSVGLFGHQEAMDMEGPVKAGLDVLHLRKIDMSDEVFVLNVGGYIGDSTRRELDYARRTGKAVRYLEPAGAS